MNIKILGTGCARCKTLEKLTQEAVTATGTDATIEKVEDIVKIMGYGVMQTPALVINEKVMVSGRVPSVSEIRQLLTEK